VINTATQPMATQPMVRTPFRIGAALLPLVTTFGASLFFLGGVTNLFAQEGVATQGKTLEEELLPSLSWEIPSSDPFVDGVSEPLGSLADRFKAEPDGPVRPNVLRSAEELDEILPPQGLEDDFTEPLWRFPLVPPLGFTGRSGVLPTEIQTSSHFVPIEDRWRQGTPQQDRYGRSHPPVDDYPGIEGAWWDPYNQNVLKGDYPIIGQHTFLKLSARSLNLLEGTQVPTATTPFEATRDPGQAGFFGDPDQFLFLQFNSIGVDLSHGNTAFKQQDWRVHLDMIYNLNHLVADELGVVSPDVRDGTARFRQQLALEQWFVETKLADTSPYYDFVSVRAGSQPFVSDFRGLIFSDVNRGVRLFGTRAANRDQFNVVWFDQTEKDTNSTLNRLTEDRHQNTWIANYYRQDFIFPGNTFSLSFHANHDQPSVEFDRKDFLVRPDPVGVFQPHDIKSYYLGLANNGHIERFNYSSALYYVFGHDDLNPLAGRSQDIDATMAALEISYDRDWVRFRTSYMFASGDGNPNDGRATGFDAILPNPNFAGAEFSYFGRQAIRLFGVELSNRLSLTPSMRNSKFQGQTNFVNPGLHLFNLGIDADLTPRLKLIQNTNFLWFDQTEPLETYLFTREVRNFIGTDISLGAEYRPLLNNNIVFIGGLATLIGGDGFDDLYRRFDGSSQRNVAGFVEAVFEY
jgi:hypothetical protein